MIITPVIEKERKLMLLFPDAFESIGFLIINQNTKLYCFVDRF